MSHKLTIQRNLSSALQAVLTAEVAPMTPLPAFDMSLEDAELMDLLGADDTRIDDISSTACTVRG